MTKRGRLLTIGEVIGSPGVYQIPAEFATQKAAFLGRTGSGKTYAALKHAEELLRLGAQVIGFDPVGVWWGLRLGPDGDPKGGFDIPIFGGLHGDIPLAPTAGAVVADLVVDRRQSVVLDVSQFESDREKARFASDFADRFFRRMKAAPAAVHVFLEECQEFVPQNPSDGEAMMLHHWTRLAKLGRNFGIGLSLISQRPQEVNKKVLNMTELLYAFQMTGVQERKTIKEWLGSHGSDGTEKIEDLLRTLPVGTARVSSPQWLQLEELVKVGTRATYNASSTPTLGEAAEHREPAPLDLHALSDAMQATVEQAKANDPKLLHRKIAELDRQLRAAEAGVRVSASPAELLEAEHRGAAAAEERLREWLEATRAAMREPLEDVRGLLEGAARKLIEAAGLAEPAPLAFVDDDFNPRVTQANSPPRPRDGYFRRTPVAAPRSNGDGALKLGRTAQKLIDALAMMEALGVEMPAPRALVAGWVGIQSETGSFSARLSELRKPGLIEDGPNLTMRLTDAGRAAASPARVPPTLAELHETWLRKLGGTSRKVLEILLDAYPNAVTREAIGEQLNLQTDTGSFSARLSELRTPGLIRDLSRGGPIVASDILFPEGLK